MIFIRIIMLIQYLKTNVQISFDRVGKTYFFINGGITTKIIKLKIKAVLMEKLHGIIRAEPTTTICKFIIILMGFVFRTKRIKWKLWGLLPFPLNHNEDINC